MTKRLDRRGILLARLGLTCEQVDGSIQVTPLFKRIGVRPERVLEVLGADDTPESTRLVALWAQLTPANKRILGLEGLALACGMTPRRLWELYNGANMMQSRESVGAMICEALPAVMAKTVKQAKAGKVHAMEHIYKAARVLPTPKGSVINIGAVNQGQLEGHEDGDEVPEGRMLEGADEQLMKFSRVMAPKALPAPTVEADEEEDEEEDE